jgi:hypothetical protein
MAYDDLLYSDPIMERAHQMLDQIEEAAHEGQAERVLDGIDDVIALYQEFPDSAWDALVMLTRSRETTVRIAMAARGIPSVYNKVNPYFALNLANWLLDDRNETVASTMRDVIAQLPDSELRLRRPEL